MKKILVLTDFSENSVNAYRYAVKMACQVQAELLVLFSTNGVAMSLTKQLQYSQQLNSFAKRYACDTRQQAHPHHTECLLSSDSWPELLPAMVGVHQPDLIIAGSDLLAAIEQGRGAFPLASFAGCPVLWVPEQASYQPLAQLAFVTDFTDQDPAVVDQVKQLAQTLGAQVSLVHFYPRADRSRLAEIKKQGAVLHGYLGGHNAPYYLLEEEDMVEGLQEYADHYPVDLFLLATRDTHLPHEYLQPAYRKTQACQLRLPLLNLFQEKKKPCAGSCAFCRIQQEDSRPQALVKE
jgi:nucleotide-binding universal stress UspA family protein